MAFPPGSRRKGGNVMKGVNFSRRACLCLFGLIVGFLAVVSLFFTCTFTGREHIRFQGDAPLLHLLLFAALLLGLLGLRRAGLYSLALRREKLLVPALMGLYALGLLLCLHVSKSLPIFDQERCVALARALAQGNPEAFRSQYYAQYFPFQIPYILYCACLALLEGGESYLPYQLANVLWIMVCLWALPKCAALALGEERLELVFLISLLPFLPMPLYVSFVYGNVPGLALLLLGALQLIRYLRDHRPARLGFMGLFFLGAALMKMNYLIGVIAAAILLVLDAIRRKGLWQSAAALLMVLLCACSTSLVVRLTERFTGGDFSQGFPTSSWVLLGLQEDGAAPGWYTNRAYELYAQAGENKAATDLLCREAIAQRLQAFQDPGYAASFFWEKAVSQWNEPSFESLSINRLARNPERSPLALSLYEGRGEKLALGWMNLYHSLILLGLVLWVLLEGRKASLASLYFPLYFLGGFLFHLLWEAKSQYTLAYFFCLLPYGAMGYLALVRRLHRGGRVPEAPRPDAPDA